MSESTHQGLSLRAKVLGSYIGVLLIFGTVLGFALLQMAETRAELSNVASGYMTMAMEADGLTRLPVGYAFGREEVVWERYSPRLDLFYLQQMERRLEMTRSLAREQRGLVDSPVEIAALLETQEQLDSVGHRIRTYRSDHESLERCLQADDPGCRAAWATRLHDRRDSLTDEIEVLSTKLEIRIQNALQSAGATQMQASRQLLWLSTTAIVLAGLMLLLVHLSLRPIDRLIRGARLIGEGRYDPVEVETHDEIGKLAEAFNRMADSLAQREKRILQMERLATVGRMSAQVAHEVRNPLNALGLNAEMLGDELSALPDPGRTEARELLSKLQQEIDRLADVTETYLSLARLPRPDLSTGDLGALIREVLAFVADEMTDAGVVVTTTLADGLPDIPMDAQQLRQALLNLLRNAAEAQPGGGAITVELSHDEEWLVLVVSDRGPGIDAATAESIFDPFISTKERGTGLGLAITRQIVEGHHGSIRYATAPGGGAAFHVVLPLSE